jgi:hypothetical protein
MRLQTLVIVVAALIFVPSASAHTTITEPVGARYPYQAWVDTASVPTPETTVTISESVVGCIKPGWEWLATGCTDGVELLQIRPGSGEVEDTFYHELGHIWDHTTMTPAQRSRFVHMLGQSTMPWNFDAVAAEKAARGEPYLSRAGAEEWFADSYSVCARTPIIELDSEWVIATEGIVPGRDMRRVCGMLRSSSR